VLAQRDFAVWIGLVRFSTRSGLLGVRSLCIPPTGADGSRVAQREIHEETQCEKSSRKKLDALRLSI
jgi:hypothetical protein